MSDTHRQVRQPLAIFYALFFSLVGCNAPYWGPYLQSLGFDYGAIGSAIAAFSLIRIVAPMLWAHWSRHFQTPLHMARIAGLLTAVCFSAIWWVDGFWPVVGVMLLYGFFWSAMLPQYEVLTMQAIANSLEDYSRIRLWGSVGFVITVALLGWLFEYISVQWLPVIMLVLMLGVVINSWRLTRISTGQAPTGDGAGSSIWKLAGRWPVMAFLLVNLLLQVSHGPLYTFFSIYLEENGYSSASVGLLWALGVIAEVILFWRMRWLLRWLSLRHWLLASLAMTALRWLLIAAFPQQVWVLLLAQVSHAFTFAMLHAVCIRYVPVLFAGNQGKGQALYSSAGFGLGGALGAWLSGYFWHLGGEQVFIGAAAVAILALIVAWQGMKIELE